MDTLIENLALAIANIKCLGAQHVISLSILSDMQIRYAEEDTRKNICHMMARELADQLSPFQEQIIHSQITGPYYDPQMKLTGEIYVITKEDYKNLVKMVERAQRFIDATRQSNLLNWSAK